MSISKCETGCVGHGACRQAVVRGSGSIRVDGCSCDAAATVRAARCAARHGARSGAGCSAAVARSHRGQRGVFGAVAARPGRACQHGGERRRVRSIGCADQRLHHALELGRMGGGDHRPVGCGRLLRAACRADARRWRCAGRTPRRASRACCGDGPADRLVGHAVRGQHAGAARPRRGRSSAGARNCSARRRPSHWRWSPPPRAARSRRRRNSPAGWRWHCRPAAPRRPAGRSRAPTARPSRCPGCRWERSGSAARRARATSCSAAWA